MRRLTTLPLLPPPWLVRLSIPALYPPRSPARPPALPGGEWTKYCSPTYFDGEMLVGSCGGYGTVVVGSGELLGPAYPTQAQINYTLCGPSSRVNIYAGVSGPQINRGGGSLTCGTMAPGLPGGV
jgi:hypothetical protein